MCVTDGFKELLNWAYVALVCTAAFGA